MNTLIIFDFSGTLSLQTVAFGRPDRLVSALRASGLWRLGVNRPDIFWNALIASTWRQGSSTSSGYARLLIDRLSQILPGAAAQDVRNSVSLFTRHYFAYSTIEAAWIPLLRKILQTPDSGLLIATDHYAEATDYLKTQLAAQSLPARKVLSAGNASEAILIANSADIGYAKTHREFWRFVQNSPGCGTIHRLILVDDFGAHEVMQDAYAVRKKVIARQYTITALLHDVFACDIHVIPFRLNHIHSEQQVLTEEFENAVKAIAGKLKSISLDILSPQSAE